MSLAQLETKTLNSLAKVDEHPLHTTHYHGAYNEANATVQAVEGENNAHIPNGLSPLPVWACSLLAALGRANAMLYGGNFE